jgi:hypothetical protein
MVNFSMEQSTIRQPMYTSFTAPTLTVQYVDACSVDEMISSSDCTVQVISVKVLGSMPTSTLQHKRIQGAANDAVLNNV